MLLEITSDLISGDSRDVLHEYIRKCENKFMCFLCEFPSTNRVHVLNHVESVHFPGSYKYQCDYCPKEFPSKSQVEFHMKKMNDQKKLYSCNKMNCSFVAYYLCVWNDHRMTVHHNEEVKVVVHGLSQAHLKQQTENQAIQTPFEMIQEYNSGDETESECMEIHQCDLCDTFFNSKLELNSHKEGGHMCEFCNVIYVTVKEKENHLKNAHSFKCPKCDLSFVSKELCTDHTKSHLVSHALPKNVIRVMTRHVM